MILCNQLTCFFIFVSSTFTANAAQLAKESLKVKYITLPGWKCSISDCRKFNQLPIEAQNYIRKIESLIGVPVRWIGVGADRASIIQCF